MYHYKIQCPWEAPLKGLLPWCCATEVAHSVWQAKPQCCPHHTRDALSSDMYWSISAFLLTCLMHCGWIGGHTHHLLKTVSRDDDSLISYFKITLLYLFSLDLNRCWRSELRRLLPFACIILRLQKLFLETANDTKDKSICIGESIKCHNEINDKFCNLN